MKLSKDNYKEIGRWLDLSSMKKMRLVSKGMAELYTMEWMREKGKEERISQSQNIEKNLRCFGCEGEMIYQNPEKYEEHTAEEIVKDMWPISTYDIYWESYYVCGKCERYYMICPKCEDKGELNLCQFVGHCGCDGSMNEMHIRFSREEDIPKKIRDDMYKMDCHIFDDNRIYEGIKIRWDEELYYYDHYNHYDCERCEYNVTDDCIFYFDVGEWEPTGDDGGQYHFWRCIKCGDEYKITNK